MKNHYDHFRKLSVCVCVFSNMFTCIWMHVNVNVYACMFKDTWRPEVPNSCLHGHFPLCALSRGLTGLLVSLASLPQEFSAPTSQDCRDNQGSHTTSLVTRVS